MSDAAPHVALLATGEELVRGAVIDRNSGWLARRLRSLGLEVSEARLVGDGQQAIERAVRELAARAPFVIVGGGLGPTEDDRTRHALAAAAGVALASDAAALAQVSAWFAARGRTPSHSNERQALLPLGARPIANALGSAPGIALRIGTAEVRALPGVPAELRAMFDAEVARELLALAGAVPWTERLLQVAGLPESVVGERVARFMAAPGLPRVSDIVRYGVVTLCAADRDDADGRERLERCVAAMKAALGDHCFAEGDVSLAAAVVSRLLATGATVALAESCTGGSVAAAVTDVPGASAVFLEGAVTYAATAKTRALGVPEALIARHGAVSEAVARAMAEGVRTRAGATWGVAVTGVAGPGGGSEAVPVGSVHFAVAGPGSTVHVARRYPGDREMVRQFAVGGALDLLRRQLH